MFKSIVFKFRKLWQFLFNLELKARTIQIIRLIYRSFIKLICIVLAFNSRLNKNCHSFLNLKTMLLNIENFFFVLRQVSQTLFVKPKFRVLYLLSYDIPIFR